MSTGDEHEFEHDPTGMRALLSSLPDPGPMPSEVEQLVLARLAAVAETDPAPVTAPTQNADVLPLARRRDPGRSRRQRWLGAVAGVAAATVVGFLATDAIRGGGMTTSSKVASDSSAESGPDVSAPAAAPTDRQGRVAALVVASGVAYRADSLVIQAETLRGMQRLDLPPEADTTASSAGATDIEACLRALDVDATGRVVVDSATYDGAPALVVLHTEAGRDVVVVTSPACGAGGAHVLRGPDTLP